MSRKLASIQKIKSLSSIENADNLELAKVLGWNVVVKKGEFKEGDFCVYCEIDSLLPEKPEFEFLRKNKFRIKTIKLRGQVSQGICFPVNILNNQVVYQEGLDVTELLGVTKWELPVSPQLQGQIKRWFPQFLPKTDEPRVQSNLEVLDEIKDKEVYITEKLDGTSFTAYYNHDEKTFGVCSRNVDLKESEDNLYWQTARKYNIEEKLKKLGSYCIQGELTGPGIQGNRLGLKENTLFLFDVFNISTQKHLDFVKQQELFEWLEIPSVPLQSWGTVINNLGIENLLELAKGHYQNNSPREGIVIRPMIETYSKTLKGRLSFKVINNEFLLKYGE